MDRLIKIRQDFLKTLTESPDDPGINAANYCACFHPISCYYRPGYKEQQLKYMENARQAQEWGFISHVRCSERLAKYTRNIEEYERHQKQCEEALNRLRYRDKQTRELGPREFTLTYSPDWYDTDDGAQSAMRSAIEKLTRYYKDEIIEFHAVGEFTGAGRAHVHGWYHLDGGRKITDKNFKRAWKHWNPRKKLGKGFEGGHHATIDRTSDFAGYAEKHLEEAWLIVNITNGLEEEDEHNAEDDAQGSQ